jgi:hypothetical protein
MKTMRLMKNVAAALAFSALTAVAAQAEEGTKINCADTDMQLEAQDFEFSCKDFSDPSAVSNAGKLGVELLEAISEKQEQYIAVWDIRAIGSIYLLRKGFEEDVRSNFSSEELAEWHAGTEVAGFEYAEYVNRRSGSSEEECIAFRRQMTRRNQGYGESGFSRIVIGIGCTTRERAVLVESLKHLDAPGG